MLKMEKVSHECNGEKRKSKRSEAIKEASVDERGRKERKMRNKKKQQQ